MGSIIKCNAQLKHKYQKYPLPIGQLIDSKKYFNESSGELDQPIPVHSIEIQPAIVGIKNSTEISNIKNPTGANPQNQQIEVVGQPQFLKEDDDIVQYRTLQQTISNTLTNQFFSNTSIQEQKFLQDDYFDQEELKQFEQQLQKFKKGKRIKGTKISWKQGEQIGTGSFGRVFQGLNLVTGEIIAIKQFLVIGNSQEQKKQKRKILEQEIELLSTLSHKNIVKYQGIEKDNEKINIFLEYISGGSLSQMIKKFGIINDKLIRLYTKQILEGLEYLHVNEVVHRDIKGANVLIEKNGVAKLSDFGSAKRIVTQVNDQEQLQTLTGTPNWLIILSFNSNRMAPEVIKQQYFGRFSDIWSLGCTVIEMATGKPPYHQYPNPMTAMFNIARDSTPPEFPENCSPILRDFLDNCFKKIPNERYNVCKLLNHKFITGVQQLTRNLNGSGNSEEFKSKDKKISSSGNKTIYFEQENPFKELEKEPIQEEGTKVQVYGVY